MDGKTGNKPIDLYLCSNGGYIAEAKAVSNVIRSLHSKVNTFATGYCASSALRVLATGTGTRAAYCNTVLMFHGSEAPEANKPHSFDAISKEIELREWKAIAKIKDEMILDTTQHNFSAQEALDMGFIDTILCDEKMNKTAK
jgi:ATP-dependent protease ClpP protease subunit